MFTQRPNEEHNVGGDSAYKGFAVGKDSGETEFAVRLTLTSHEKINKYMLKIRVNAEPRDEKGYRIHRLREYQKLLILARLQSSLSY